MASLALALLSACPPAAMAGGFQVSPTLMELRPGARVASFQLANRGDAPVSVQIDALAWSQSPKGGDALAPANELVITPRRVEIAPGSSRQVRLALDTDAGGGGERAYRVRFRELPGVTTGGGMGVATLVEQNVPLFFNAQGKPELAVDAHRDTQGRLWLDVRNTGARHARLGGLKVWNANAQPLFAKGGPRYVLAGSQVAWTLSGDYRVEGGDTVVVQLGDEAKRTLLVE